MRGASVVDGNIAFKRSSADESSRSRAVEQVCKGSVCGAFTPCQAGHVAHDPHEQTGQAQLNVGSAGLMFWRSGAIKTKRIALDIHAFVHGA